MHLHLLGTSGYHPNNLRHTACLMIPEAGVVLDAGTGFFRVRDLIQTPDLHIFLTHAHLDHCIGLSFFIDVVYQKNVDNIFVYGIAEKLHAIRTHLFSEHLFPVDPGFHWVDINTERINAPCDIKVQPIELRHPGGSLGFRLDWPGYSMAYITDTTAHENAKYVESINKVDLLVHECHFPDGFEQLATTTGHSCLTPVAEVSRAANVGKTVIVHLNPLEENNEPLDLESAKPVFENMLIGADNMVLELKR